MKSNRTIVSAALALCMGMAMQSCMPQSGLSNDSQTEISPEDQNTIADPANTQSIVLYSGTGDNIAGIYFTKDGALTSTNGWLLNSVGWVSCLGKVVNIPRNNWDNLHVVGMGEGLIGYHPDQGFARFYVGGLAIDQFGEVCGVGVKFVGSYYGVDEKPTVDKENVKFDAAGGTEKIKVTNESYTVFQSGCNASWCKVTQTPSKQYSFIMDGIEVTAEPNTTGEERSTTILLATSGGMRTYVTVTQAG